MEKNIDIRIVRTKKAINKVFIELIEEIGFSKINVQKIIERAEINRSTFYSHYIDKFDLLDKTEDNLLSDLKNIACEASAEVIFSKNVNTEVMLSHISLICKYMHENGKIFALLMSDRGDPSFYNKINAMIKSIWGEKRVVDKLSISQGYALAALVGMLTNLVIEWVKSDFRETPEEFVQIVCKIVKDIPQNIFW